jgi:hypothetical protein
MVSGTTDYNYTTYGTSPTLDISITCATSDTGLGTVTYYDWATRDADEYHGTFVAIGVTNADNTDVTFSGADHVKTDGTYYWYVWDLAEIWNDAGEDDDGTYTFSVPITIRGAFDIAYINVFNELKEDSFAAGALVSGYDMNEDNLDFVA